MKRIFAVLFFSVFATSIATAQSLNDLKEQYQPQSPLAYEALPENKVVEAGTSDKTETEEQIAELRAKEDAEKKAQEERIYLDTDYQFFQSLNLALDEDELDKAYQAKLAAENLEKLKKTDSTVKTEISTTAPALMSKKEGTVVDEKRVQILKKIAANGQHVRACIVQHKKAGMEFKGTAMTLAWEVEPSGKVLRPLVKATDIESKEIQECVVKALAEWNFSEVMKAQSKNSHIEYTYRFVNPAAVVSAK